MLPNLFYALPPQQPIFVDIKSTRGRPFKIVPIKKCPVLRYVKSLGRLMIGGDMNWRSPLFHRVVCISSKVKWALPTIRVMWYLADFTAASHKFPNWSALGEMKLHEISNSRKKSLISDWTYWSLYMSYNSWICLWVPTKVPVVRIHVRESTLPTRNESLKKRQ